MRFKLGITAAVLAGVAFAAPVQAADEIVLGLSFGKTGLYSTINKTTEVAVDIAVAEINAAGGINGKKLRIVKFDTAGDPKQAVVAVRKFKDMPRMGTNANVCSCCGRYRFFSCVESPNTFLFEVAEHESRLTCVSTSPVHNFEKAGSIPSDYRGSGAVQVPPQVVHCVVALPARAACTVTQMETGHFKQRKVGD